jgi:hypothetical protein
MMGPLGVVGKEFLYLGLNLAFFLCGSAPLRDTLLVSYLFSLNHFAPVATTSP